MTIQHRPGKQNHADGLSRIAMTELEKQTEMSDLGIYPEIQDVYSLNTVLPILTKGHWQMAVNLDRPLSEIKLMLQTGKVDKEKAKRAGEIAQSYVKIFNLLKLEGGLVYCNGPVKPGAPQPPKLCVPLDLQQDVVKAAHEGHTGISETINRLRKGVYFPHMHQTVEHYVNNCVRCLQKFN